MSSEHCNICNNRFTYQVKRKRFDRSDIESKLKRRDHSIKDVLDNFINVTPDKKVFICSSCVSKVDKCGEFLTCKKDLENAADSDCYLGYKILYSPCTPCTSNRIKRIRVTSTPLKGNKKSLKSFNYKMNYNFKSTALKH